MTTPSGGMVEPTAEQSSVSTTGVLPAQPGEPQVIYVREPSHWFRRLLVFVGTFALIIAVVFGLMTLKIIPSLSNPFAKQTTDRSGPVLLDSMKDLSQYVAAEGNFQVLVDLQENNKFIPDFLFNERTLFVGVGSVDAYVDFSKLTEGSIKISPDGKSVEITLPQPVLEKPSIDTQKSYTFAEEKGAVNRFGDLFGGDPNKQAQLYQLAEQKIAEAARDSELVSRAQRNTEAMLKSLLTQLGFERITITWTPTPTP